MNDNIKAQFIVIDNKEYVILDKIINSNITYYYLSNVNCPQDIMINKSKNNETIITGLDSEEEVKFALQLYLTKNS